MYAPHDPPIEKARSNSYTFPVFNITGEPIKIQINNDEPTVYSGEWIPAEVIAEYPKFLVINILPHKNQKPNAMGECKGYTISVNKLAIHFREVRIRKV